MTQKQTREEIVFCNLFTEDTQNPWLTKIRKSEQKDFF
jgi:hypothetical protein